MAAEPRVHSETTRNDSPLTVESAGLFSDAEAAVFLDDIKARHAEQKVFFAAKRAFDVVASLLGLLVLSPLFLVIALIVRLDSRGPAIFAHERVGRDGKLFKCWKFRSMYRDADDRLRELLSTDPEFRLEWIRDQKVESDPRVTRIGQFLRRSSMDELPQLFNVLVGEMSLVGPRPITEGECVRYGNALPIVLLVRPGITGIWQVSGRNSLSYSKRVELDVTYACRMSVRSDAEVLWVTRP